MKNSAALVVILFFALSSFAQQAASAHVCVNNAIEITFSAANDGKFRFKTREKGESFGKSFATRQSKFNEKVYLEWQVGYDASVEDVKSGKKQTKLVKEKFLGSNGKEKFPFELSEILHDAIKCGLISVSDLDKLANETGSYKKFIDERAIIIEKPVNTTINEINFKETSIKLPTLFMSNSDGTVIEVSIQKQQYAADVQPMIYLTIPFKSFSDWKNLDGKKSVKSDKLTYIIKKENADVILNTFRVFGTASLRHKFDVEQILKTVRKLLQP